MTLVINLLILLIPLQFDPNVGPGDSCPGAGDCCTGNGTVGCSNTTCCQTVCTARPDCCSIGWSLACADLAMSLCGGLCGASICPTGGDCCAIGESPGCLDTSCCATVCGVNESCCFGTWGADCVNLAEALCDPLCNRAGGCPGTGDCCFANGTSGCDDSACCETVCGLDSFCCDGKWDDLCAQKANDFCGDGLGSFCKWCPSEGNCCEGRGTPGCDRQACCELVCAASSRCCTTFWDSGCASFAARECAPTACACLFFGDANDDGLIDLRDAADMFTCFTGPAGGPIDVRCACVDDDGDGDVDLTDYQSFASFFVVTNRSAVPEGK